MFHFIVPIISGHRLKFAKDVNELNGHIYHFKSFTQLFNRLLLKKCLILLSLILNCSYYFVFISESHWQNYEIILYNIHFNSFNISAQSLWWLRMDIWWATRWILLSLLPQRYAGPKSQRSSCKSRTDGKSISNNNFKILCLFIVTNSTPKIYTLKLALPRQTNLPDLFLSIVPRYLLSLSFLYFVYWKVSCIRGHSSKTSDQKLTFLTIPFVQLCPFWSPRTSGLYMQNVRNVKYTNWRFCKFTDVLHISPWW